MAVAPRYFATDFCSLTIATSKAGAAMMFLWIVPKMHRPLTFSATIENDDLAMKTLAVISILALLTVTGAASTDELLTSDQGSAQRAN
jgi:hypothetical protein